MNRRSIVLAGLLAAVILIVSLVFVSTTPPGSVEDRDDREPDVSGPPDTAPPEEDRPESGERPATDSDEAPTEAGSRERRVAGRLTGLDPTLPGKAALTVTQVAFTTEPPAPVLGAAGDDGRFDLDVQPLLETEPAPSDLEIRVDHPAYLPVRKRVRNDDDALRRVEIALSPAARLLGRVVDAEGAFVAGATVSVHALATDGVDERPQDVATTDDGGGYRLRAMPDRERLLLVAWSDDHAAAARVVSSSSVTETSVPDLVLPPGEEISGRVVSSGQGVAGAGIRVGPYPEKGLLDLGDVLLAWDGERVRKSWFRTETAPDGSFRLTGLVAGKHEVTVEDVPGIRMHSGFANGLRDTIDAPAAGLEFDVTGARLVLSATAENRLLEDFRFFVEGGDGVTSGSSGGEKSVAVLLAPEARHTLQVFRSGFEPVRMVFDSPARGGEKILTVALVPEAPRASLVIAVRSEEGAPAIDRMCVSGYHAGDEIGPIPSWYRNALRAEKDGRYRFEKLFEGRWTLVVRPGTLMHATSGYDLYTTAEVVIDGPEEIALTIDAKLGGRLRIAARDAKGAFLEADCRVLTTEGRALAVSFLAQDPASTSFGTGSLVGRVPNEVNPPLPAGTYRLELSKKGYHSETTAVEVLRGKTTTVNVVLDVK